MATKQKKPKLLHILRYAAKMFMLIIPDRAQRRVSRYYGTFFDLFSIMSEDKGFFNNGIVGVLSGLDDRYGHTFLHQGIQTFALPVYSGDRGKRK